MAQLTIEVPDALLPELEQVRSKLPMLLTQWITSARSVKQDIHQTTSQEVLSFLMTQPTPQDILNFKVSERAQTRLKIMLDRNCDGGLSEDESFELNGYEQLGHWFRVVCT